MVENITKKFSPNFIKGAAATAALGSVAVPAVEIFPVSPKIIHTNSDIQTDNNHGIELSSDVKSKLIALPPLEVIRDSITNRRRRQRAQFTGYVVSGRTSTFGWPVDSYNGTTADGGYTDRACIAIRNDSTLDHMFQVTVNEHQADMPQCDWGPAAWTGRSIDITGDGVTQLHMNPWAYPTGEWGVARELRNPK